MVRLDVPIVEPESAPWWEAATQERLLIRRCAACGKPHLYPRPFCPHCWSQEVTWEQASGLATLYTYSVVRFNDLPPFNARVPYIAGIVELAEGPRLTTTVVDVAESDVHIGMPLRVRYHHDADMSLPVFGPA